MPHVEIPQAEFKVVLLGSSHIGKSSLVTRFSEGYYRENSRQPTVGAAFVTKRIQSSENVTCKVQIWDTAGQPSFRGMAHMFYKDAAAVIVCYDVGSRRSFDEMREWLDELRVKLSAGEVVVAIAALKADLMMQQQHSHHDAALFVPEQEVQQLAETLGVIYLPTSAKTDRNVQALFQRVADQVLQNRRNAKLQRRNNEIQHKQDVGDSTTSDGGVERKHSQQQLSDTNSIGSHASDNHVVGKQSSPRRSKYDKYYVREGSDQDSSNANKNRTPNRETKITVGNSGKKKKIGAGASRAKSKRDNTLLEADTDDSTSRRSEYGMCSCQPVACGAGDHIEGSSGCIMS
eukprot:CCRYP_009532-RA/>CCRYP_009532-RA protein AED:0.18 eAED:0.18 QI:0/-1/0/1/-1/1/1/0/345